MQGIDTAVSRFNRNRILVYHTTPSTTAPGTLSYPRYCSLYHDSEALRSAVTARAHEQRQQQQHRQQRANTRTVLIVYRPWAFSPRERKKKMLQLPSIKYDGGVAPGAIHRTPRQHRLHQFRHFDVQHYIGSCDPLFSRLGYCIILP